MINYVSTSKYRSDMEQTLKRYEDAGLTPVDCMTDITDGKGKVCYADGYADGALVSGVALIIGGLICKWLAKREVNVQTSRVSNHLAFAASVKPLTDFNMPTESDDREENND